MYLNREQKAVVSRLRKEGLDDAADFLAAHREPCQPREQEDL